MGQKNTKGADQMKEATIALLAVAIFGPVINVNDNQGKTLFYFTGLFGLFMGYVFNLFKK